MHVVFERRKEALQVILGQPTLLNLLGAGICDHSLHLVNRDVTILIDINLLSQVSLESILRLELLL